MILAAVLATSLFSAQAQSLLHIRVVEGEGAVHAAGSKTSRGIVVQITDETGRPVEGAMVSFRMPEEGPRAAFARDMPTEIVPTTPEGRAAVYEMICGRIPGPFQIRVTAVKDKIRAGTVVSQYISEQRVKEARGRSGGRSKWIAVSAVVAAGAAAGIAAGMARAKTTSSPAATATSLPSPPQIGTPSISIGRP